MKTEDRDGYLWVIGPEGKQIPCVRVCGAVAWGDPTETDETVRNHAVMVAGEGKDGTIRVFEAHLLEWLGVVEEMVKFRRDALCLRWFVDPAGEERLLQLRRVDGLTFNAEVFTADGLRLDTPATLTEWWPRFTHDLEGARAVVDGLRQDKILKYDQRIPSIKKAFSGGIPEQLQLQTPRCFIALVWHMYQTMATKKVEAKRPKMPWG